MAFAPIESLDDGSRVWIYRSDRILKAEEVSQVNKWLGQFIQQWTAHNQTLEAYGEVYHDRFVVIVLDEIKAASASGCSIDAQVRFIKEVGTELQIDFFDRLNFDFMIDGDVVTYHKDEVKGLIEDGKLSLDSLVFDHLVKDKSSFLSTWTKPLSDSWHMRLI